MNNYTDAANEILDIIKDIHSKFTNKQFKKWRDIMKEDSRKYVNNEPCIYYKKWGAERLFFYLKKNEEKLYKYVTNKYPGVIIEQRTNRAYQ